MFSSDIKGQKRDQSTYISSIQRAGASVLKLIYICGGAGVQAEHDVSNGATRCSLTHTAPDLMIKLRCHCMFAEEKILQSKYVCHFIMRLGGIHALAVCCLPCLYEYNIQIKL